MDCKVTWKPADEKIVIWHFDKTGFKYTYYESSGTSRVANLEKMFEPVCINVSHK